MKKRFYIGSAILISIGLLAAYTFNHNENEKKKESIITDLVINGLQIAHYENIKLDDNFSREFFDSYIKSLDYTKKFLLKSDIDQLLQYRDKIDDQLKSNDSKFFELSNELIEKRVKEAATYFPEILDKPFDYKTNEEIELDDEKNQWCQTIDQLKGEWHKSLKYQVISEIDLQLTNQENALDKKDTTYKVKTFEEIEKAAREKVLKRNKDWFHRLEQIEHFDRLSMFLNTFAASYDPHTNYFPPKDKEDFDISMSGQLEGIGATLQEKDGYVKVVAIVPGSPSWKQGQLKEGDLIIKVAQGDDEPIDVVDMRLDKAVKLIRGKKGTTVKLTVKKGTDGSILVIPIVRDVVIIEDTYAKSVIVKDPGSNKKFGYIYLPQFYVNFNEKNGGRRSADDVLKEIIKLKKEGIDGLIVDLRNNGGGSLPDVVKMAGFFIPSGPIVQVKERDKAAQLLRDTDQEVYYDGPLAVMVNENSASASEIFAAAMQDYQRGVIIGSKSTFGKGTVQRFIDLDQLVNSDEDLKPFGAIKMTFQKFYRVNGGSTQLEGVKSDVVLPDYMMYIEYGERELENFMPWDKIEKANFTPYNRISNIDQSKSLVNKRVKNDPDFKLIERRAQKIKESREKTTISLNLDEFRKYQKNLKEENKVYENLFKDSTQVVVQPLQSDMLFLEKDSAKLETSKKWMKTLKGDIYVRESINVLHDIMGAKK